jgi:hypothetical protein
MNEPIKQYGGRRPGAGRKPGVPNKLTADIRASILEAYNLAGGAQYLLTQSQANPQAFMALIGKVIPREIEQHVTGNITLVDEFTGQ